MVKRKFISTRAIKPGMVIDQSIIDRSGRILIARKTGLDDFLIEALQKMKITGIYIREGEEDPETEGDIEISPEVRVAIEKLTVADRSKVKLSESVKKRVSQGIKFLYNDTSAPNFIDTATNVTDSLVGSIMENEAVALNIDTLKFSDEYTFQHSVDVATIAMLIAKNSNMSEGEIQKIGMAGLLHDMGKSKIPNEILNKAGKLTEEEFAVMKNHALFGYQILKEKGDSPGGADGGTAAPREAEREGISHGSGFRQNLSLCEDPCHCGYLRRPCDRAALQESIFPAGRHRDDHGHD